MTNSTYPESSNATLVLVLGIVGLFFNILSPVAWYLGNEEVKAIDGGRRAPENRSVANAGRILGIIGTVLLAIGVVILLALVTIGLIALLAD